MKLLCLYLVQHMLHQIYAAPNKGTPISLRKQTYLTYTMDFNPGRRSPGFKLALTSGEDFLPTHRAVSSSGKPHKDMSLSHFGALKSDAV